MELVLRTQTTHGKESESKGGADHKCAKTIVALNLNGSPPRAQFYPTSCAIQVAESTVKNTIPHTTIDVVGTDSSYIPETTTLQEAQNSTAHFPTLVHFRTYVSTGANSTSQQRFHVGETVWVSTPKEASDQRFFHNIYWAPTIHSLQMQTSTQEIDRPASDVFYSTGTLAHRMVRMSHARGVDSCTGNCSLVLFIPTEKCPQDSGASGVDPTLAVSHDDIRSSIVLDLRRDDVFISFDATKLGTRQNDDGMSRDSDSDSEDYSNLVGILYQWWHLLKKHKSISIPSMMVGEKSYCIRDLVLYKLYRNAKSCTKDFPNLEQTVRLLSPDLFYAIYLPMCWTGMYDATLDPKLISSLIDGPPLLRALFKLNMKELMEICERYAINNMDSFLHQLVNMDGAPGRNPAGWTTTDWLQTRRWCSTRVPNPMVTALPFHCRFYWWNYLFPIWYALTEITPDKKHSTSPSPQSCPRCYPNANNANRSGQVPYEPRCTANTDSGCTTTFVSSDHFLWDCPFLLISNRVLSARTLQEARDFSVHRAATETTVKSFKRKNSIQHDLQRGNGRSMKRRNDES